MNWRQNQWFIKWQRHNILRHVIYIVATQCETVIFPRVARTRHSLRLKSQKQKKKIFETNQTVFPKSLVRIQPLFSLSVYDTLARSYSFHLDV